MTPDSVSGDQNMYVKQYRSEIRLALGGVDDIDFNLASTAYEIKTLYETFSFGRQTWPHLLTRVMLIEQIYRAFEIKKNSNYHK